MLAMVKVQISHKLFSHQYAYKVSFKENLKCFCENIRAIANLGSTCKFQVVRQASRFFKKNSVVTND